MGKWVRHPTGDIEWYPDFMTIPAASEILGRKKPKPDAEQQRNAAQTTRRPSGRGKEFPTAFETKRRSH